MSCSHCVSCGWYADSPLTYADGPLCIGCANGREPEPAPIAQPEHITGGYIRYTDGTIEPCHHYNGTYPDGSCVDCGYC